MPNYVHQYAGAEAAAPFQQSTARNPLGAGRNGADFISIPLEVGDDLAAGDLIKFITLQEDTIVMRALLSVDDLDSNGAPTITVDLGYDYTDSGLTDDDDYWLANSTIAQAGGTAASSAAEFVPEGEYTVQAKVETAAATAAAGSVTLHLEVFSDNHGRSETS